MDKDRTAIVVLIICGALIFIAAPAWWIFSSSMEAKAYNRVTGQHVTTWDAMWVELRVQDAPKK